VRTNSTATSWGSGSPAGTSLPLSRFYVVKPGATAAQINAALAAGQNLLVTPGVHHLDQTLKVTRPDTVVLGLGLATFVPDNGITAMTVADVDGVKIAGLLFDAGLVVGGNGSTKGYAAYKVADSVTSHRAYGLGSYCYFNADPGVTADRAVEAPDNPNVKFTSVVTVSLAGTGTIGHIIDNSGGPSNSSNNVADPVRHP
jgi:hypothetical protein